MYITVCVCSMKIAAAAEDRFDNDKRQWRQAQVHGKQCFTFPRRTRHLLCVTWEFRWSFPFSHPRAMCWREVLLFVSEFVA